MIIETSCNRFYSVHETNHGDLEHVWIGTPAKKINGEWTVLHGRGQQLVRKAGSRVVEA